MTITAIIVIVLLAIIAAALLIALPSIKAAASYDRTVCKEYAELRAKLDAQSDRAAQGDRHADAS